MTENGAAWLLFGRSTIRRRILGLLILNPGRRYHVREIARQVKTSAGTASRELRRLEDAGTIDRTVEGMQVYYEAKTYGTVWETLDYLMRRTEGVRIALRRELEGLPGIESALLFGSYVAGTILPDSDVDLLIVGTPDRDELTDRLEAIQKEVGRPINEVVMTPAELAKRRSRSDAFIESIDHGKTLEVLP